MSAVKHESFPINITTLLSMTNGPSYMSVDKNSGKMTGNYEDEVFFDDDHKEQANIVSKWILSLFNASKNNVIVINLHPGMRLNLLMTFIPLLRTRSVETFSSNIIKDIFDEIQTNQPISTPHIISEIMGTRKLTYFSCFSSIERDLIAFMADKTILDRSLLLAKIYDFFIRKIRVLCNEYQSSDVIICGSYYSHPLTLMSMLFSTKYYSYVYPKLRDDKFKTISSLADFIANYRPIWKQNNEFIIKRKERYNIIYSNDVYEYQPMFCGFIYIKSISDIIEFLIVYPGLDIKMKEKIHFLPLLKDSDFKDAFIDVCPPVVEVEERILSDDEYSAIEALCTIRKRQRR